MLSLEFNHANVVRPCEPFWFRHGMFKSYYQVRTVEAFEDPKNVFIIQVVLFFECFGQDQCTQCSTLVGTGARHGR